MPGTVAKEETPHDEQECDKHEDHPVTAGRAGAGYFKGIFFAGGDFGKVGVAGPRPGGCGFFCSMLAPKLDP
jgi:hypothetical protein